MSTIDWPWKPNADYTRLLRALQRQGDPHHVPFLELFADPEVVAAVLGEPLAFGEPVMQLDLQETDRESLGQALDQKIRFWHRLGYDAVWQGILLDMPDMIRLRSQDTADLSRGQRRWADERAGVITSWAEFERYPWPRATDADLYPIEYVAHHLPEGMAIVAGVSGFLEPVMWLMGYETFALAIYDQPDLVEALFARIAEIWVPLAHTLAQMDRVIALGMGDDMGFKTGTLIAPDHLRRFVLPLQKQIASLAHAEGIPFILHSCGNLEPVMDDLVDDVGIDAKHSFEDVIEPVEAFSARYGDRVAVIGGVDMDLLARGTEAQVRARTQEILETCAPGGGYVLGSGNTIANYVPPRNLLAMLDEGWRYNARAA